MTIFARHRGLHRRRTAAAWGAACVLAGGGLAGGTVLTAGQAAAAACPAPVISATGGTVTFCYTGAAQTWTVPSGVSSATFTVDGAAGFPGNIGAAAGGLGGAVMATLASLSPGQVFTIGVGGVGGYGAEGAAGGNGGGNSSGGGGGGGLSSVALGSTLELLAGGGGGGGGGQSSAGGRGGEGGSSGTDGSPGDSTTASGGTLAGGGGGNAGSDAVNPGQGGDGGPVTGSACSSASSGLPGQSGSADQGGLGIGGGGGGGGGYVGGGGGGQGAGDSCANAAAGEGGGGGGSSYALPPGAEFAVGVQSGSGKVVISYQIVTQAAQVISFTPPASGIAGQSATLTATGGGSGIPVEFAVDPSSGAGVCSVPAGTDTVDYLAAGTCLIDATEAGDTAYAAATPVTGSIPVYQTPAFTAESPPLAAATGTPYSYQFTASGSPAPSYTLSGAPSWLAINPGSGLVSGTPPAGIRTFSYSVTAGNSAGSVTTVKFTVTVSDKADIRAVLSCPASLTVGKSGTCTLTVTNAGPALATRVAAGAAVPAELQVTGCSGGCSRFGGVLGWSLGSVPAGQSGTLTVSVKAVRAGLAVVAGGGGSANPDPSPFNNLAAAATKVTK